MGKKPFWKTAVKDWGVVNFLEDKVGKSLPARVLGQIAEAVADSNPITSVVMDLVTGDNKDVPAEKFSQEDLTRMVRIADRDQKMIDNEVRLQELENERMELGQNFTRDMMKDPTSQKYIMRLSLFFIAGFTALVIVTIVMGESLSNIAVNILFFALGVFADGVGAIRQRFFGGEETTYSPKNRG